MIEQQLKSLHEAATAALVAISGTRIKVVKAPVSDDSTHVIANDISVDEEGVIVGVSAEPALGEAQILVQMDGGRQYYFTADEVEALV